MYYWKQMQLIMYLPCFRGNHPLTFEIQQSEKVRIQNDGKVGIGTDNPSGSIGML